jgi:acyl-CoA thioesterase I
MQKRPLIIIGIIVASIAAYVFFAGKNEPAGIRNYPPKGNVIIAFGDSLVAGVGSSQEGGFVPLLADRLQKPVINRGKPGDTTADALARVPEILQENPHVVIILLGGNDAIQRIPLPETVQNLRSIITMVQAYGAVVVLLGVQGALIRDRFDDNFRALAKEEGAVYVPNVLKDIYRNPSRMFDAIHPNDEGYRIIADRAYPAVAGLFTE